MGNKATRERNTLPQEDIVLIHRYIKHLLARQDNYSEERWEQSTKSWAMSSNRVWDCYKTGATWAIRCVYLYQYELDKPNREWRPSIIMRTVLETARLATGVGVI